jgi:hypothetical protein
MQTHNCEVDGCSTNARWERVSKADADLHLFLCSDHWKELHSYNWIAAAAYSPIHVNTGSDAVISESSETPCHS